MKNCDEMVNSLLERREQYITQQKCKRKLLTRTVTSTCCVCLVALLGFSVWKGGVFNAEPPSTLDDSTIIEKKDYVDNKGDEVSKNQTQQNQGEQTSTPSNNDTTTKYLFAINEITGAAGAAPKYRDPNLHYNEVWDFDKASNYLGINIPQSVAVLPDELELHYTENNAFSVIFNNSGTIVEDRICYEFFGNNEGKLTVLASKLRPPYDCFYASNTDEVTNLRIPETDESISLYVYAQNKSDTALEYDLYVIDFEYGGNYYRITAENIRSYNLDSLIREIVK